MIIGLLTLVLGIVLTITTTRYASVSIQHCFFLFLHWMLITKMFAAFIITHDKLSQGNEN